MTDSHSPTTPPPIPAPDIALSVVIVTYNRLDDLRVAIASVRATEDMATTEIIVIDNGSNDGTRQALRAGELGPLILYASPTNLYASAGRNVGIRIARGPWIAFLDSDAELLESRTLSRLAQIVETGATAPSPVAAAAPAIYLDAQRTRIWLLGGYFLRGRHADMERMVRDHTAPDFISTCVSVWRRDVLERAGAFDPYYPYCFEDCDLSWRVREAGYDLIVDPSIAAAHYFSPRGRERKPGDAAQSLYLERVIHRHELQRLGVAAYLRELRWQWSRAGRAQRWKLHGPSQWGAWMKFQLYVVTPLRTLLNAPRILRDARDRNFLARTHVDESCIERIGGA